MDDRQKELCDQLKQIEAEARDLSKLVDKILDGSASGYADMAGAQAKLVDIAGRSRGLIAATVADAKESEADLPDPVTVEWVTLEEWNRRCLTGTWEVGHRDAPGGRALCGWWTSHPAALFRIDRRQADG